MNTLRLSNSNTTLPSLGFWVEEMTYTLENLIAKVCDCDDYHFGLKVLTEESVFNGMEKDNEIKGKENSLDFGARIYDSRLGRWLSLDPLSKNFPSESNYSFAGNSPVYLIDKEGKYKVFTENEASYNKDYPMIMKYLYSMVEEDFKSTAIHEYLKAINPEITDNTISTISKWNKRFTIEFVDKVGEWPNVYDNVEGGTGKDLNASIQILSKYALNVENILKDENNQYSESNKLVAFMRIYMTLLHETGHEFSHVGKLCETTPDGTESYCLPSEKQERKVSSFVDYIFQYDAKLWDVTDFYDPENSNNTPGELGIVGPQFQKGATESVIKKANETQVGQESLPILPTP